MHRHVILLTCCCFILLIHRVPLVSCGTLSASSLSSSESAPFESVRIRTQRSGSVGVSDEDLEFSDTSHGEVTNSDQQIVYINHGGGAVSSIRRSFALPFSPHVSSYPTSLFDGTNNPENGNTDPDVGPEYSPVTGDAGFSRRAGAPEDDRPFDGSFDDHSPPESHAPGDPAHGPHDPAAVNPDHAPQPVHPAPLGLPVPPTSFGSRTFSTVPPAVTNIHHQPNHNNNNNNHQMNPVSHFDHRIAEPDNQRNQRINFIPTPKPFNQNIGPITAVNIVHHQNNNHPNHNNNNNLPNNNINRINPLLNAFSPIASGFPQALSPDFFNLFDAPFSPIGATGGGGGGPQPGVTNDNLFQRRRLSIQNTPNNEISHNSLAPVNGYPNGYNFYAGNEEIESSAGKWPKIFKFSDGRINLYDFEKDKKIGRIKFSKDEDPLFDGVRRDSFLILHGGTYS